MAVNGLKWMEMEGLNLLELGGNGWKNQQTKNLTCWKWQEIAENGWTYLVLRE